VAQSRKAQGVQLRSHPAKFANREALPTSPAAGVARQMDFEPKLSPAAAATKAGAAGRDRRVITTPPHAVAGNALAPAVFRNIGNGWNATPDDECALWSEIDIDDVVLYQNKVAITPLQVDLTAYEAVAQLRQWFADPAILH
jgi:hypothetical protein